MIKYFIFAILAGFVVCFQNCSGQEFSTRTDLNKASSLDGSEELIVDDNPSADDVAAGGGGSSATGGNSNDGGVSAGGGSAGGNASAGSISAGNSRDDDEDVAENEEEYEVPEDEKDGISKDGKICMRHGVKMNATDVGVCILEGRGKSSRVAMINDEIVANNSTPKTVCMTAYACRKIVDNKFKVVTLEKRGHCVNSSADTVNLTDAQVRSLIDKIQ